VTGAVLLGLAALLALACAALAWTHPRRVLAATGADAAALGQALRRLPVADRLRGLLERTAPGSWEHELAADALAAPDGHARVLAANVALADMEHALRRSAGWPRAGLRIGLLGHALLALSVYLADPVQPRWAAAILAVGGATALACVEARRSGEREAVRQRRAIDALLGVALPDGPIAPELGAGAPSDGEQQARWWGGLVALPDEAPARPRRSERRARRRRGVS
jgi:hypothetical protein